MQEFSLDTFRNKTTDLPDPFKKIAVSTEKSPLLIDKPSAIVYNKRIINYFERHSAKNGLNRFSPFDTEVTFLWIRSQSRFLNISAATYLTI